jgi:hypothetical protein
METTFKPLREPVNFSDKTAEDERYLELLQYIQDLRNKQKENEAKTRNNESRIIEQGRKIVTVESSIPSPATGQGEHGYFTDITCKPMWHPCWIKSFVEDEGGDKYTASLRINGGLFVWQLLESSGKHYSINTESILNCDLSFDINKNDDYFYIGLRLEIDATSGAVTICQPNASIIQGQNFYSMWHGSHVKPDAYSDFSSSWGRKHCAIPIVTFSKNKNYRLIPCQSGIIYLPTKYDHYSGGNGYKFNFADSDDTL